MDDDFELNLSFEPVNKAPAVRKRAWKEHLKKPAQRLATPASTGDTATTTVTTATSAPAPFSSSDSLKALENISKTAAAAASTKPAAVSSKPVTTTTTTSSASSSLSASSSTSRSAATNQNPASKGTKRRPPPSQRFRASSTAVSSDDAEDTTPAPKQPAPPPHTEAPKLTGTKRKRDDADDVDGDADDGSADATPSTTAANAASGAASRKPRGSSTGASPSASASSSTSSSDTRHVAKRRNAPIKIEQLHFPDAKAVSKSTVFSSDRFASMPLDARLVASLKDNLSIEKATHIQQLALPTLLEKRDGLVQARTGTGKTLVFLLPILNRLLSIRTTRADGTRAIIIAPTRELAAQIHDVLCALAKPFAWIVPGLLTGGMSRNKEKARIRKGITVVVATPGRLLDHLRNTHSFVVTLVETLVLDEADRLLDLGFDKDVKAIRSIINERASEATRHGIMLSATINDKIRELANSVLSEPEFISEKEYYEQQAAAKGGAAPDDRLSAPSQIVQSYVVVPCKQRLATLAGIIRWNAELPETKRRKMMVFISTTSGVEFLYELFSTFKVNQQGVSTSAAAENGDASSDDDDDEEDEGARAASNGTVSQVLGIKIFKLHGDMDQASRSTTYREFASSRVSVLLCTDVAARGLDLPDIEWVVQYDPPTETSEYIHRIGRSGRMTRSGRSLLFLQPSEEAYVEVLCRLQKTKMHKQALESILNAFSLPFRNPDNIPQAILLQHRLESAVASVPTLTKLATKAFRAFISAYSTHPRSMHHIFHVKNLHLGHVAKAWGLASPPSLLDSSKKEKIEHKREKTRVVKHSVMKKKASLASNNVMSEFESGL